MTKIFTAPNFQPEICIADADRKYSEDYHSLNNFEFDDKWDVVTKQRSNKFAD